MYGDVKNKIHPDDSATKDAVKQSLTFTVSSSYTGNAELMCAESRLYMLRSKISSLETETNAALTFIEDDIRSNTREIARLKDTIVNLRHELFAVKDSFLYFDVFNEMDNQERIKYQQQFIQQEIEISNLRESNKQFRIILDKYRDQTDINVAKSVYIHDGHDGEDISRVKTKPILPRDLR